MDIATDADARQRGLRRHSESDKGRKWRATTEDAPGSEDDEAPANFLGPCTDTVGPTYASMGERDFDEQPSIAAEQSEGYTVPDSTEDDDAMGLSSSDYEDTAVQKGKQKEKTV